MLLVAWSSMNAMGRVWLGMIVGAAVSAYGAWLLTSRKKEDSPQQHPTAQQATIVPLSPLPGESRQEYEERCRNAPKDTPVECYFGCQAGRNGLTAKNVKRHQERCDRNPAKQGAAGAPVPQTNP
jgi:hypothetical protein